MSSKKVSGWPEITWQAAMLGAESWIVIGLRAVRLAGGGPEACREARLMVTEKVASSVELGKALIAGDLGETPKAVIGSAVSHYLSGVRANRKRLSR